MPTLELSPGRLGRRITEVRVAGARVNRATYAAGSTTPAHVHPRGDLCVVLRGRYEERWGQSALVVEAGQVVVKAPGVEHVNHFGPHDVTCLNVDVSAAAWSELVGPAITSPRVLADPRLARLGHELDFELTTAERASPIVAEELVLSIVRSAVRADEAGERQAAGRWLVDVRDRLHAHFAHTLHLDELAAGAGVHPAHLTRSFRKRFGRSVGQYVCELRVAAALRGIAEPDRTLADVAASTGFSDQSHMGRVLRRETGLTPGGWRARFQRERSARSPNRIGSF